MRKYSNAQESQAEGWRKIIIDSNANNYKILKKHPLTTVHQGQRAHNITSAIMR